MTNKIKQDDHNMATAWVPTFLSDHNVIPVQCPNATRNTHGAESMTVKNGGTSTRKSYTMGGNDQSILHMKRISVVLGRSVPVLRQ